METGRGPGLGVEGVLGVGVSAPAVFCEVVDGPGGVSPRLQRSGEARAGGRAGGRLGSEREQILDKQ